MALDLGCDCFRRSYAVLGFLLPSGSVAIDVDTPLCIDIYCGLGGWSEGFIAEGYRVIGFDNHRHVYGSTRAGTAQMYPGQLVLQDALTLHGSQFRDAAVIVASPPCQNYSYLAMPWSRSTDPNNSKAAKALRLRWETEGPNNRLFDACFRIQREAIEATRMPCLPCGGAGVKVFPFDDQNCSVCGGDGYTERHIPLIVENVRGAQEWVGKRDMPLDQWLALSKAERLALGRSKANYGSFHLWGDVAMVGNRIVAGGCGFGAGLKTSGGRKLPGNNSQLMWSERPISRLKDALRHEKYQEDGHELCGQKVPGFRFDGSGRSFQSASVEHTAGGVMPGGTKIGGDWFSDPNSTCRKHGSRSAARKAASAQIAKIPGPLSAYIAQVFKPRTAGKVTR